MKAAVLFSILCSLSPVLGTPQGKAVVAPQLRRGTSLHNAICVRPSLIESTAESPKITVQLVAEGANPAFIVPAAEQTVGESLRLG